MNKYIEKIKKLRIEKGFSQGEIAKKIGISRPTYATIEKGTQKMTLEQAQKLSAFFGLDIESFVSKELPKLSKYKHMILAYLRMNLSEDNKIPKTKLAKLLYLADFVWFYDHLESMSGMQYRKLTYGPVPDLFFRALGELEEDGKITIDRKSERGKDMFLISESESNSNENLTSVSKEEKEVMEKIAKKWKSKKTKEIVNFTHNQLPYFLCRDEELIPYELIIQEDPDKVY